MKAVLLVVAIVVLGIIVWGAIKAKDFPSDDGYNNY